MKLTQLAARDQDATNRMVAAAEKLAELHDLDTSVIERVQTQRGDPPVRAMLQREAVADLLEKLIEVAESSQESDSEDEKAETKAKSSSSRSRKRSTKKS